MNEFHEAWTAFRASVWNVYRPYIERMLDYLTSVRH